ncbi:PorV/PorQ family protein [candidate division KSB1 bacterium]|nr:PorV/PorQ family protein [candidate division KSB1 bacterium]
MKSLGILLTGIFLFSSTGKAQQIAKYAGEFMSLGVGARSLGMGSAHVAVGGDATFGYWNPAGLSPIQYPELTAMHSRRFGGVVNYDYVGIGLPFRKSESFAISMIRLAVDDIPFTALPRPNLDIGAIYTDSDGNQLANRPYVEKVVSDAEYAFYLSYSKQRSEIFAYGANVKFVRKGVGDYSAWGIGFDVGILWNPVDRLRAGLNIQDITTTLLAWNTGHRELIAPTAKLGVAYPLDVKVLKSQVLFAADTDIRFEGRRIAAQTHLGDASMDFFVGTEFLVRNVVAVRVGHNMGHLTAGAGIRLPRLDFDYAFLSHDQFETTHRVSFRLRIEEKRFARK